MTQQTVTVLLLNTQMEAIKFYGDVQTAFETNRKNYTVGVDVVLDGEFKDDKDICEEVFDLTNNPSRQQERVLKYGNRRSVSVGDVVCIESKVDYSSMQYVCAPCGWVVIG